MAITKISLSLLLAAAFNGIADASPAPQPDPVAEAHPDITPFPASQYPTRTYPRRNILSDLDGDVNSVLSLLGSVPGYVASGVPNFFQDFPTGDKVQSSLGIDSSQLAALPTQALVLPPYANWTAQGWNVRFHGNVSRS